ncbi:MAG: PaaI family thioesterase [Candidatus Methanoplasma sp.]|jgi:acyl-CoA thioesterase|nr:PaaI family thioesterase [Candidatus Methanoplasma sp.]
MDMETLSGLVGEDILCHSERILAMCNAPYAAASGIELVRADAGRVSMRREVRPEDLNSNGVAHGAVTYGLADHAFAVACNISGDAVGLSCNITYHRPCPTGSLEAEAEVVNESRSLVTVYVRVTSGGRLIATADCIGFKKGAGRS